MIITLALRIRFVWHMATRNRTIACFMELLAFWSDFHIILSEQNIPLSGETVLENAISLRQPGVFLRRTTKAHFLHDSIQDM